MTGDSLTERSARRDTRWLARFRFGPAEWLWRSLTYGQAQPFRR